MHKKSATIFSKLLLQWIPLIMVIYLVVYTVVYVYAYQAQLSRINSDTNSATPGFLPDSWDVLHEKAFLTARLEMAGSDSIGLTVNLRDSVIQLELKGVVLRQLKFEKAEIPAFFGAIHPVSYIKHFSNPFIIDAIEGAIVKEPVTVKKVPKDSLEAAAAQDVTLQSVDQFVEWHVLLNNTFVVSIVQIDEASTSRRGLFAYRLNRYRKHFTEFNQQLLSRQLPIVHPEITIYIPAGDAKAFYRALPPNGQVVVVL